MIMYLVLTRMPGERGCTSGGVYSTLYLLACQVGADVPLVEVMYFVLTRMPGESGCTLVVLKT